jgi:uncharacterized iron-regulated membrane protein
MVIIVCVSAIILWWQRRPSGQIGAPAVPPFMQQWRLPLWIVAILGIIFPLVGVSLITVLLLDYLVLPHFPRLQHFLS